MFALLSSGVRRWLILAVGAPAAAWALDRIGQSVERRRGPSRLTRALGGTSDLLRRNRRRDGRDRRAR